MMLAHHGALDKLKLFHLEDGGFNHQRDYKFASNNGTELNSVLPKMSPLRPEYLPKKKSIFKRISEFVEKFKDVGGKI